MGVKVFGQVMDKETFIEFIRSIITANKEQEGEQKKWLKIYLPMFHFLLAFGSFVQCSVEGLFLNLFSLYNRPTNKIFWFLDTYNNKQQTINK